MGNHVRKTKKQRRKGGKKQKKEKMKRNMKKRLNKKGLRQIKKKKQIKRKKGAKKDGKVSGEASEGNRRILNKSERKKEEKFTHCDYLDLTEIGLRNDESFCESGGKFLFKAMRGHRRQFLMTNTSNIAVFLKHKHKITNCTQLNDITERVKCKPVPGVSDLKIKSAIG